MTPTGASRRALVPLLTLLATATGCPVASIRPLDYPPGDRVRSFPVAVEVEVADVVLDLAASSDVKTDDPATLADARELRRTLRDLVARDLAERGPFGVAPGAPAVLRLEARQTNMKTFFTRTCRVELRGEVRDRSGALLAKASGASDGECWIGFGGQHPKLHLSPLAAAASDALRRALAQEAPALVTRISALAPGAAPAPAGPLPAPAAAPWLAGAAQRERRLAVLEFAGPLEPALLAAMSDEARAGALEAVRPHRVSVMTRESMQVVLAEMGKSALCIEGECEVETARNIGADLVVSGSVLRVEGVQVLTLKLHETAKGTLLATASARGKSGLEALDAVRGAAAALFR